MFYIQHKNIKKIAESRAFLVVQTIEYPSRAGNTD